MTSESCLCLSCEETNPIDAERCQACGESLRLQSRYRVRRRLGRGAAWTGYEVLDTSDGTRALLKLLDQLSVGDQAERVEAERIQEEGRLLRRLEHPAIVGVRDELQSFVGGDFRRGVVYDWVEGERLTERVERDGPLDEAAARRLLLAVLDPLAFLHGEFPAVIHQNLRPSSILLRPDGGVVLTDFGAASTSLGLLSSGFGEDRPESSPALGYTPPELDSGRASPASDFYGLGTTLMFALSGRAIADHPMAADGSPDPTPLELSPAFEAVLARMVARDPAARFQSVDELRRALASSAQAQAQAGRATPRAGHKPPPLPGSGAARSAQTRPPAPAPRPAAERPAAPPAEAGLLAPDELQEAANACLEASDWRGLIDVYRQNVGLADEMDDFWGSLTTQLQAVAVETADPQARSALLTELGDIYRDRLDDGERAIESYQAALDLNGENLEALRRARAIYALREDHAMEMRLLELEHRAAREPARKAELLKTMGRILLLDLSNARAARQRLELARRDDPSDPETAALLSLARGEHEDLASAYRAAGLTPPAGVDKGGAIRDRGQAARPARQVAVRQRAERRPQRAAQQLTATTGQAWTPAQTGRARSANKAVGCIMAVAVLLVGIVGAVVYFVVGEGVGGSGSTASPPEVAEMLSGTAGVGWQATPQQLETLHVIWASELVDYTTEYDSPSWAADQVLGPPDVYPDSGDRAEAWAPEGTQDTFEWVTVRFSRPVEAIFVVVLETYNPGAIMRVDDMSDPDRPVALWQGGPVPPLGSSQVFLVQLPSARRISAIRVVLDSSRVPGWNEIDAIGLIPVDQASGRQPQRGPSK